MLERFNISRAIPFSQKYSSNDSTVKELCDKLWEEIPVDKTKKVHLKKECLEAAVLNLRVGWTTGNYIRYSCDRTYYSSIPKRYNNEYYTYNIMCGVLKGLNACGYTIEHKGFRNPEDKCAQQTKIIATDELTKSLKGITNKMIIDTEPPELVILHERRKSGIWKGYSDTDEIRQLRRDLKEYNELRQATEFSVVGYKNSNKKCELFIADNATNITSNKIYFRNPYIYRVFNEDFKTGGRYYDGIESNMPKELRKLLYINGEKTVEKDFSGMHVRMLYNLKGENPSGNFYDDLSGGDPTLRKLYKLIALISINAGSEKAVYKAVRKKAKNTELKSLFPNKITDDAIKVFYDTWLKAHSSIAEYFNSDIGVKLQFKDSLISSGVIKHFTKKGIPVLVIHDSFIVNEQYSAELVEVMKEEYKKQLGFEPEVC
jgi:hypothetical protein